MICRQTEIRETKQRREEKKVLGRNISWRKLKMFYGTVVGSISPNTHIRKKCRT